MSGEMMVAAIRAFGGPEQLRAERLARPEPGPGEARLAVAAAGVNPVDLQTREGRIIPADQAKFPLVLGWDAAGTVDALGEGAAGLEVGQRVVAISISALTQVGTYAEAVVLPSSQIVALPDDVDLEVAATLPTAGLAGLQAYDALRLGDGDTVVINGALGAIGRLATQLAVAAGAHVFAPVRSDEREAARALGIDELLERGQPIAEQVQERLPGGADAGLDVVGGSTAVDTFAAVRDEGRYSTTVPEWLKSGGVFAPARGVTPAVARVDADAAGLRRLVDAVAAGTVRSPVAERFSLDQAADAHRRVAKGGLLGKVIITP